MRLMLKRATLLWVLCLGFIGYPFAVYSDNKQSTSSVHVYKLDGTRHCESGLEINLFTMEQELISTGIKVISRRKGFDGREGVALCGAQTGQINIYEISTSDLSVAISQGFMNFSENR